MPRTEAPDDPTRLTASRIDIPARIGWILRTHREVGGLSLRQMSAALREHDVALSAPTLSRIESEGQRSPAALDGYALVLGLPPGALRCQVDSICRSFSYAPAEPPAARSTTLAEFSASYDAVTGPAPTGGDWLAFARQHADASFGLPAQLLRPLVRRLSDELERALGLAQLARYEALALLRCSRYADVVDGELRAVVLDERQPFLFYTVSAQSELSTPGLAAWFGELLSHPSTLRSRAASYGLQNMLVVGGLPLAAWHATVPAITRAWHLADGDAPRRAALAQLVQALPPSVQEEARGSCEVLTPPRSQGWSRDRRNTHYEFALETARAVCRRRGHREEPLLGRLVFEAAFETRGVRMSAARALVTGSPFAADVVAALFEGRAEAPGPTGPAEVLAAVSHCHTNEVLPGVEALLDSDDPEDARFALGVLGRSGGPVPDRAFAAALADPDSVRAALYAAGMSADPRLAGVAADPAQPAAVRHEAAWWAERSGRVLA